MENFNSQDASGESQNTIPRSPGYYALNEGDIAQEEEVNYSQEFLDHPHIFGSFDDQLTFDLNVNDNVALNHTDTSNIQPQAEDPSVGASSVDDPNPQSYHHEPQQMLEEMPALFIENSTLLDQQEQEMQLYGGQEGGGARLETFNRPLDNTDIISPTPVRPTGCANSRQWHRQHGGLVESNGLAQQEASGILPTSSYPPPLTSYSSIPPAYRIETEQQMGHGYTPGPDPLRMDHDEHGNPIDPRSGTEPRDRDGNPIRPRRLHMGLNLGFYDMGHQSTNMTSMMNSHNSPMNGGYTGYTNHDGRFNENRLTRSNPTDTNMLFDSSTQNSSIGYTNHAGRFNENQFIGSIPTAPNMPSSDNFMQNGFIGNTNHAGRFNEDPFFGQNSTAPNMPSFDNFTQNGFTGYTSHVGANHNGQFNENQFIGSNSTAPNMPYFDNSTQNGFTGYTNHAGVFNENPFMGLNSTAPNMLSPDDYTQNGSAAYINHHGGFNGSASSQWTTPASNTPPSNDPMQGSLTGQTNTTGAPDWLTQLSTSSTTGRRGHRLNNPAGNGGLPPYLNPHQQHVYRSENTGEEFAWRPFARMVQMTEGELEAVRPDYTRANRPYNSPFNHNLGTANPPQSPRRNVRVNFAQEDALWRNRAATSNEVPALYRQRTNVPPLGAIYMIRQVDANGNRTPWSYVPRDRPFPNNDNDGQADDGEADDDQADDGKADDGNADAEQAGNDEVNREKN